MEILLGGLSSLLYGVADFLGGEGAKRAPASSIVLWSSVVGFPLIVTTAFVVGGEATIADYALGVAAGGLGAVGLVMLFTGLARGRAAVVAPVAAALSALIPVAAGVLQGERPSGLAWVGVAVGIPAIVLSSWVEEDDGNARGGLWHGVSAGIGFGGFFVVISFTASESELLPLVTARAATMLVVLALAGFGIWRLVGWGSTPTTLVVANGVFDATANVTLLLALRAGSLALAAVAASFYPAVTVLLAKLVNSEHLHVRQAFGLALTLVALGLIAAG